MDIQDREEAVAILTREDSTNVSLLLARPEIEVRKLDMDSLAATPTVNTDPKMCLLVFFTPPSLMWARNQRAGLFLSERCKSCVCSLGKKGDICFVIFSGQGSREGRKIKRVQITQRGRQRQIALGVPLMSYHIVSFKVTPSAAIGPF